MGLTALRIRFDKGQRSLGGHMPRHICAISSAVMLLMLAFVSTASAQLFTNEADTAIIKKRAVDLNESHKRACEQGIVKHHNYSAVKIVSWEPDRDVRRYKQGGGWPGGVQKGRFEDSLVIMVPTFESIAFSMWFGTPLCFFGRDGKGPLRFIQACSVGGAQSRLCDKPS